VCESNKNAKQKHATYLSQRFRVALPPYYRARVRFFLDAIIIRREIVVAAHPLFNAVAVMYDVYAGVCVS
jgi:hypothetical protein